MSKQTEELVLPRYQEIISSKIQQHLPSFGGNSPLRNGCEYALVNGGKRVRPAIVLMVAEALGHKADVTYAALAIEYFHTASLVADDLPCMDDDDLRRSKPSVHKVFGEAAALLVSYALIAEGYGCLEKGARSLKSSSLPFASKADLICSLALENASFNTGPQGATGGQFIDLFPPNLELATLREVIHKKTVSLFEVAFVFGWLYGGGDPSRLPQVKKMSSHFGMAFQIADDLGDIEQDAKNGRLVNMAAVMGVKAAENLLQEEISQYQAALEALHLRFMPLHHLVSEF